MLDYLIVGHGIAGASLASTLQQKNKFFLVIDNPVVHSASKVAGGIVNPMVFKRLTKSWLADDLIPSSYHFFKEEEKKLTIKIVEEININRILESPTELNNWEVQSEKTIFEKYIDGNTFPNEYSSIKGRWMGAVKQSFRILTKKWLEFHADHLKIDGYLMEEKFNYSDLKIESDFILWKTHKAKKIVFCEGASYINNPYFKWLPFKLTKGELLEIECKYLDIDFILSRGIFIFPNKNKKFTVGATYNWENSDPTPSKEGKQELIEKLEKLITVPYKITNHLAGIRPTTKDRRPILGQHPKYNNMLIFNGLGTKGCMIAPLMAEKLYAFSENQKVLDKEINISRFYKDFE